MKDSDKQMQFFTENTWGGECGGRAILFSTFFVCSEKLHKSLHDDVNSWKKENISAGTCFS